MSISIMHCQDRAVIQKTEVAEICRDQAVNTIYELSEAMRAHKNHGILLDVRGTESRLSPMSDLLTLSNEFVRLKSDFTKKIAMLLPNVPERAERAERFKVCMVMNGFDFDYFTDFDAAIKWLCTE